MSAHSTPYRLEPDGLAQISGTPGAPVLQPTFGATVQLNPSLGIHRKLLGVNTTSATCTVNTGTGSFGQLMIVHCAADASGTVTYTFGTNFKSTGTAAPTAGKSIIVAFVSDGANFFEFARSAAAITG